MYKTGDQDAIEIASLVKAFAAGKAREPIEWDWQTRLKNLFGIETEAQQVYREAYNSPYPHNLTIRTHSNLSRFIEDRLNLLERNGLWGLLFVFLSLLVFLNWRVAFWVMMGLVVSVAGSIVMMQLLGATLNLISMFGLIVVLGLIVDDAIVVSENVYARVEAGEPPRVAAVRGAQEVTWPVIIAVTTTIAAFAPLLFVEGRIGDFMGVLPVVVMCALSVSLLEALSILPAHLAKSLKPIRNGGDHNKGRARPFLARLVNSFRGAEAHVVKDVLGAWYERLLRLAIAYRYVVIAAVVSLMLLAVGLIHGGHVPFVLIQKMDSETVLANLDMPIGTPAARTLEAIEQVEHAVLEDPDVQSIWTVVGAQLDAD
ncbi:MAG: efflux RND transporter permease subunit, partial [Planctomycetota bacterium]